MIPNGLIFQYNNKNVIFRSLILILPFADNIINDIQYLEIDASFKAIKPYSYCIFHGVIFNSSTLFALSNAPRESLELFELLFDGLKIFKLNFSLYEKLPVLSDMGSSIIPFCKKHNMFHYFCHRHLMEYFGQRSSFGRWVKKILNCLRKLTIT